MANRPSLDDYVDVAERIVAFKEKHPDGTLQTVDWEVIEVAGKTFVVYRAAAYRTPDDERPGHGSAWEPFPGPTPYTKDSELMNAETAAWGRAVVAVGLAASKKIGSRQEVQARADAEPLGPVMDTTLKAVLGAACTQVAGGDREKGKTLFDAIKRECGDYFPQAALLAVVSCAEALPKPGGYPAQVVPEGRLD